MLDVCIIILNYNDAGTTEALVEQLTAWQSEKLNIQIIVVDNHSSDDSFQTLSTRFVAQSSVTVLQTERNGGYSYGNNFGVRYAEKAFHPEYLAIANPDIEIDCETMELLLETFQEDDRIGLAAPVMYSLKGDYSICSQRLPLYREDLFACFQSKRWSSVKKENLPHLHGKDTYVLTEMLPGSFFVARTSAFLKAGMFDEGVFLFCEERILGNRLKQAGFCSILRTDLKYVHAHSVTIKKHYNVLKTWRMIMNSRYYYEKQYNRIHLPAAILLKLCMEGFLLALSIKLRLYHLIHRKS